MSGSAFILLASAALILGFVYRWQRPPLPYRGRGCLGRAWRRAFPGASKDDIRRYLRCFVDGMAITPGAALKFDPDDRVLDVYRALYGGRVPVADGMECETFLEEVGHAFDVRGADLLDVWHREITLGELFASATGTAR